MALFGGSGFTGALNATDLLSWGSTSSFPALKRNGTGLDLVPADSSLVTGQTFSAGFLVASRAGGNSSFVRSQFGSNSAIQLVGTSTGGEVQLANGAGGAFDAGLKRGSPAVVQFTNGSSGSGAINILAVAGAVSDASFTSAPPDNTMAFDSTNKKIYVRFAGAWVATAALT